MPNLISKKNKQYAKLPTSIQDEFSAVWSGKAIEFEMEGEDDFFAFILDEDEEDEE